MENTQICRLCLESKMDNGGFLVEIFSSLSLINEPGKMNLAEKIRQLFGLKIELDDGLPSLVCHKCLVLTENCMDFRDKCLKNDEKLRLIFKVNGRAEEPAVPEVEAIQEAPVEAEAIEEEEEEVITLNPNKLYESSDESENENPEVQIAAEHHPVQAILAEETPSRAVVAPPMPIAKPKNNNIVDKKEIYHCRYCDVVFSDSFSCNSHELNNHDLVNPYECVACAFNTDQHIVLIAHIKQLHNAEKPFLCTQCTKSFVRRSDLKKHTFVHAGIRLFSCDICKKAFTRNTNLTKHKRTHSENMKSWKCKLCPKAFFTNSELLRHLEVHMDRKALVCKHCNQAFTRRDKYEIHLKTHFESSAVLQIEVHPPTSQPINTAQPQPIVFYNQPQMYAAPPPAPMNFYTENTSFNMDSSNHNSMQIVQPKKEFPIMNQLLSQTNQIMQPQQPTCGICNHSFTKKKDLDRHVMSVHTNLKKFKCGSCSKAFNRKDKLVRHEKVHLPVESVFNCSLCPAVFVRQQMLEIHSKIHQMGNGEPKIHSQLESFLASLPPQNESNGFSHSNTMMDVEASQQLMSAMVQSSIPSSPAYPMNLSISKSSDEPMNLSNDIIEQKDIVKTEVQEVIDIESDEDDELRIVEDIPAIKKSPHDVIKYEYPQVIPEQHQENSIAEHHPMIPPRFSPHMEPMITETKTQYGEPMKTELKEIIPFMTMEPLRDLPMEILNND